MLSEKIGRLKDSYHGLHTVVFKAAQQWQKWPKLLTKMFRFKLFAQVRYSCANNFWFP